MGAALTLACLIGASTLTVEAPRYERARAADAALRAQPERLKFRHHILRVVRLWQTAVKRGVEERRVEAKRGEVEAWALLAHWSGRADDAARVRREREVLRALMSASAESKDVEPAGPAPHRAERAPQAHCPSDLPLIVLDPGHGGEEEGAHGPGFYEKDYNLDVAFRVRALLRCRAEVLLTREADETVTLSERVQRANRSRAVLFVSIHGNAHPQRRFHGVETYVLDTESERFDARLAHREATLNEQMEVVLPEQERDVRLILADLAMRAARRASERLARAVHGEVVDQLREEHPGLRDLGLREALFYVLLGARMPAILVESGFMTHPEEGRRMGSDRWRARVAQGIAAGVAGFLEEQSKHDIDGLLAGR